MNKKTRARFDKIETQHSAAIDALTQDQRVAVNRLILATMLVMQTSDVGEEGAAFPALASLMQMEAEGDPVATYQAAMWLASFDA